MPDAMIPSKTVSLKPGEVAEIKVVGTGAGLRPYTSAQPVLAKLSTSVLENGAAVDVEDTRFGYRSVQVKGGRLALNGQPVTFLGTGPNITPHARRRGRHDDGPHASVPPWTTWTKLACSIIPMSRIHGRAMNGN